ncbi:phage portal protein [Anoxybacillus ayderensis]|uniref:phage portal protein n=1 Tax=Anoxybacillus sp. ST70 TaxID=2864180 RepID=UPI00031A5B13|nr:phage portal protein [Anoxybacillus ayderensis G10]MBW9219394.1 phage portal protein [Anoxybacillus sp. ST70]THD16136.1 phage portal protein [Anoxybacillus ayderensis]
MLIEDLFRAPWHEQVLSELSKGIMTDEQLLAAIVKDWETSDKRKLMVLGERYYRTKMDIEKKQQDITWRSNQKLAHDFVKKLVNQKVGYLLSKEPTIATENKTYRKMMQDMFDKRLLKTMKNLGKEAINKGIAFLYVYIDEKGELSFKKIPSEQIIPFWKDNDHEEIVSFIRVYEEVVYTNTQKQKQKKVEYHHPKGIKYYVLQADSLVPDVLAGVETNYHFTINEKPYLWERMPLIVFKYNEEEQPLIDCIKSLVDDYNLQASVNADLLADIPNFIYKLVNYGGTDLQEFLNDLNRYRAVKLDENGDVGKLQADLQTDAVEKELLRIRKAIYEFGRGVDTQDENLGNASGVALRYRYSDLDMDCNILETEFQSSLEQLIWFIDQYLLMTGKGDFTNEPISIIFNRDIIINESEVIANCQASVGILDDQTIRENHPWYTEQVEERLKKQQEQEQMDNGYQGAFQQQQKDGNVNE